MFPAIPGDGLRARLERRAGEDGDVDDGCGDDRAVDEVVGLNPRREADDEGHAGLDDGLGFIEISTLPWMTRGGPKMGVTKFPPLGIVHILRALPRMMQEIDAADGDGMSPPPWLSR